MKWIILFILFLLMLAGCASQEPEQAVLQIPGDQSPAYELPSEFQEDDPLMQLLPEEELTYDWWYGLMTQEKVTSISQEALWAAQPPRMGPWWRC